MTDVVDFVNQIAAAQSSDAKDTLHNLLSQKAHDALDDKKQEIAKNMFSNGDTPPVEDDTGDENLDVEVQDTADTPVEEPEVETEVEEQPEEQEE